MGNDLSDAFLDILREVGNIGAGNATTALAGMINEKINLSVPKADILGFDELVNVAGGVEDIVAGIYVDISGDLDGVMMFMVDFNTAKKLIQILMGYEKKPDATDPSQFSDIELSALTEVGNIITGSYLTAISSLLDMTILPSIPSLCIDMAGAILSVPAIEFGKQGDTALLIESQFNLIDDVVNGYFAFIPTEDSYNNMLRVLSRY